MRSRHQSNITQRKSEEDERRELIRKVNVKKLLDKIEKKKSKQTIIEAYQFRNNFRDL